MRQNFISTAPLQMGKNLKKAVYETENTKLKYHRELLDEGDMQGVYFPIMQPMANLVSGENEIVFTTIVTQDNEDAGRNYELYRKMVKDALNKKEIAVGDGNFHEIRLAGKDSLKEQIHLFDDLVKAILPEDRICACLTFGNKPNIATLNMALEYAQKCIEGVSIDALVYGRFPHGNEGRNAEIYDYSALIYMNSLVNQMTQMNVPNPAEKIALLLGMDE